MNLGTLATSGEKCVEPCLVMQHVSCMSASVSLMPILQEEYMRLSIKEERIVSTTMFANLTDTTP